MSKRQENERNLLTFLETYVSQYGYSPSTREMAEALGFKSVESVHRLLVHLRDTGKVSWEPNKARTLRVVTPSTDQ